MVAQDKCFRLCILVPSLEDGIGMHSTYRGLMLVSECDVKVGVLHLSGERNQNRLQLQSLFTAYKELIFAAKSTLGF